jgi:Peptidase inhibitor I78 family
MRIALALLALALPACATARQDEAPIPEPICQAESASALIGRVFTGTVFRQARRMTHTRTVRLILPGQMVTQDFVSDRLNLHLDANGKVERISCG